MATLDLSTMPIRTVNEVIRGYGAIHESVEIVNPDARHYIAVGLTNPIDLTIHGSAGYFCGGLSDGPLITVEKNVSWGVGDNMLAGTILVGGNAGAIAGEALRGGEIIIMGNMGSRAGQVMKKGTLCCAGNSSFMAGYMMYGGRIIILGNSGQKVGENMAGGEIFVGGVVESLGSDAMVVEPKQEDVDSIMDFLAKHGLSFSGTFKKIVCAGKDLNYGTPEPRSKNIPFTRFSGSKTQYWNEKVQEDIRVKSLIGRYRVRGYGASRHVPHFDDIAFKQDILRQTLDPLAVEKVDLRTFIGERHGAKALDLSMPVMIAPMSLGALSPKVKTALGMASSLSGISENTGEGGMSSIERAEARQLISQCLSGRLGWNIHDMKRSDGIELYISQGAKPGLGGQLMAAKLTGEIAKIRGIPQGMDLRSPSRHPDVLGGDDLIMKVRELREAVGWRVPISLKLGGGRTRDDVKIAYKDNIDFIELDGLQGGTGAAGNEVLEYVGIPTISALMEAMDGLAEIDAQGKLPIVLMGGIKNGIDAAKAIALGATAVGVGTPMLIAGGCIGCMQCSSGKCPLGLTTQNPELVKRFDIEEKSQKMHKYLESMRWQLAGVTHALGHTSIKDLCRDDLVALTPEAAALTRLSYVPRLKLEYETIIEIEKKNRQKPAKKYEKETGTANYPNKSFDLIQMMATTDIQETIKQQEILADLLKPRDNPFPQHRPAHLDDVVFLSAALTRLVIDPYRESCTTKTRITRSIDIGPASNDKPFIDLEIPLLFTGFDKAPLKVRKALASALSDCGCGYVGRSPLLENLVEKKDSDKDFPWFQLILENDIPSPQAQGLIYVMGDRFKNVTAKRLYPEQLLGLSVKSTALPQAIEFALENSFDTMILDSTRGIEIPGVELDSSIDLTIMRDAISQLRSLNKEEEICLINFGGLRSGTDVAKALACNCTASILGTAMAIAFGGIIDDKAGNGSDHTCMTMNFPQELDLEKLTSGVKNFIRATAQETAIIARCAGKTNIHNLEPEDMRTITLAASRDLGLPLTSGPLKREGF